ncbi:TPA: MBL fold metallo-hydrolase [bacterium]|nr:MBL fold metallo-hydrolase [bacterium]
MSTYIILKKNFSSLNIDIKRLKYIVISHEHQDHAGGLWYVLSENPAVKRVPGLISG